MPPSSSVRSSTFIAGSMHRAATSPSPPAGCCPTIAWWIAEHGLEADGRLERGHDHALLEVLVREVRARERRQLDVEPVHGAAGVGVAGCDGVGRVRSAGRPCVPRARRGRSTTWLGEVGQVRLDGGLDRGVLVLGVGRRAGRRRRRGAACVATRPDAVGRVEAAGVAGQREQLGPDALVDVAVQVEGDELRARRCAVSVDDGHGGPFRRGVPVRRPPVLVLSTIVRSRRRARS